MSTTVKITNATAGVMLGESTDDLVTAVQRALHAVVGVDAMDTDADSVRLLALLGSYWSRPESAAGPADSGESDDGQHPDCRRLGHDLQPSGVCARWNCTGRDADGLVVSDDEALLNYRGINYVRQAELVQAERDSAGLRSSLINAQRDVQSERSQRERVGVAAARRVADAESRATAALRAQETLTAALAEENTRAEAAELKLLELDSIADTPPPTPEPDPRQLHLALGQLLATADQAEVTQALQLVSARHVGLLGTLRTLAASHVEASRTTVEGFSAMAEGVLTQYAQGVRRGTVDLWA